MAIFNGHTVTNDGRNLLGRALSGAGKIVFTKAAFGQGTYTGDLREIKELVDKRLDCVVSDILNDQGTVNIKIQITNKNLTESFRTEEFGIYAKIEGDATEILYCYAAAQESDSIPNNSFGDTFMAEHTVYLAFSSDAEADIYIKEGAVFLTRDTADKSYVIIDLEAKGDLSSGKTSLEADKIYKADDGKWYKNIGGDRSWMSGNGVPDELLKLISWEQIYKDLDKPFGTNEGEILEGHRLAQALGLEFAGELNNNDLKQAGKAYWDNVNKSIYKCLVNTTLNYADASYFEALSNNDLLLKLQNLSKVIRKTNIYVNGYPNLKVRLYEYNTFFYIAFETLMYVPKGVIISLPDWNFPSEYAISTNLTHDWPTNSQEFGSIRYEKIGIRVVNNIPESSVGYILIPKFV